MIVLLSHAMEQYESEDWHWLVPLGTSKGGEVHADRQRGALDTSSRCHLRLLLFFLSVCCEGKAGGWEALADHGDFIECFFPSDQVCPPILMLSVCGNGEVHGSVDGLVFSTPRSSVNLVRRLQGPLHLIGDEMLMNLLNL